MKFVKKIRKFSKIFEEKKRSFFSDQAPTAEKVAQNAIKTNTSGAYIAPKNTSPSITLF